MVDHLIDSVGDQLQTAGAYTSVGNYSHQELLALATALCVATNSQMPAIMDLFATQLMHAFVRMHPEFFQPEQDILNFLLSVDEHIHANVRKIYPDANPPKLQGTILEDGSLLLNYSSSRPFAELAIALTRASGEHFGQELNIRVVNRQENDCAITLNVRKIL